MNLSNLLTKHTVLWATHLGSLFPAAWLLWDYVTNNLSVNPIQDITFRTGKPALVLLILSLAVTPVSSILGLRQVIPARKWLGLYAFFYTMGHFLVFIWLDYGLNWGLLYEAIFEKRYALVGFVALLILLPLAITSTKGWMKRLGKRWKSLHRLVYLAGILAVIHYVWLVKSDIREPLAWGALLGLLLILRIPWVRKQANTLRTRLSGPQKPEAKRPQPPAESQAS
ncbi:sulfoxide reductase heme-binding subunit YedZ [bacterium]|nr:sulfoxide reductase heme-binding subunit YedZ [bacterium]